MFLSAATTVYTHNLAAGVLLGVILSCINYTRIAADTLECKIIQNPEKQHTLYHVNGPLMFAGAYRFEQNFDFQCAQAQVTLDLRDAHIADVTARHTLQRIEERLLTQGCEVTVLTTSNSRPTLSS